MKFKGRIYRILPTQTGKSQRDGSEWMRQDFIFEYFEQPTDRYSDRVVLSVMGDRIREYDLHEGEEVIIGFGHSVREYQGRYFNDVRLYHLEKVKQVERQAPAAQPQGTVAPSPAMPNAPASATPRQGVAPQTVGQAMAAAQPQHTGNQWTQGTVMQDPFPPQQPAEKDELPF